MWLGQHLLTVALQTTAMRQVTRIRTKFLGAVLRQDIAWYDTNTTSDFASKMTEDLNKIQDGIGEKMGMLVRLINYLFRIFDLSFHSELGDLISHQFSIATPCSIWR